MSVEWIEHKGKRILLCDHRGLESEALIEELGIAAKAVQEGPGPGKSLVLVNFEGAVINSAVMARLKELGQEVYEARTEKSALVGVTGIRHVLLAAYNRVTGAVKTQRLFDNQEAALDWLVS